MCSSDLPLSFWQVNTGQPSDRLGEDFSAAQSEHALRLAALEARLKVE